MVREDLIKSTIRLRERSLSRTMRELQFLLDDAVASSELEGVAHISDLINRGRTELRLLHQRAHELSLIGSSRR